MAEDAAVVRRIFAEYRGGQSPRAIAKRLNGEGIPGPRGGKWTASLLLGNVERENGNGPLTVMGSKGRLGCANHVERGTCENRRTIMRDRLVERVLVGLKERMLTPRLVEEFVRAYVAEINAANRERTARQAGLLQDKAKLDRQIRNVIELIKDGQGSAAMVQELRGMEHRREIVAAQVAEAASAEPVPDLHPNLPEV